MAASSSSGNGGVAATAPSPSEIETLEGRIVAIRRKLRIVYRQIVFLSHEIRDLKRLYKRAEHNDNCAFRHNIRMRMSIASGIKTMYCYYARTRLDELVRFTSQKNALESQRQL
ncbi:uncharacterized protein LOC119432618 [Dermacentor silvarum]|uniref:uncharacterized protein LOC119432618 n=1 Tax=Dermacentor silvarum TaxID=543639 RepID=UPI00189B2E70|nr:uncharacterized protein LOC119432618 [Dermacentor silvarum]